jgi:hypothetical protein
MPSAAVDAWFSTRAHPQLELMQAIREVILGADPRITESVKWQTPTFEYRRNMVSINPQARAYVSLLFHQGARISGIHRILEGGGDVARYVRIDSTAQLAARRQDLEVVVRAWCDDRDRDAAG